MLEEFGPAVFPGVLVVSMFAVEVLFVLWNVRGLELFARELWPVDSVEPGMELDFGDPVRS